MVGGGRRRREGEKEEEEGGGVGEGARMTDGEIVDAEMKSESQYN